MMSSRNKKSKLGHNDKATIEEDNFIPFTPKLTDCYNKKFITIIKNAVNKHGDRRLNYLNKRIEENKSIVNNLDFSLEGVKFITVLCILRDLLELNWRIVIDSNSNIKLAKPNLNQNKAYLRKQLQKERNIQLKKDSIDRFINKMEKVKEYNGEKISITNLIGDKEILVSRIKEIKSKDSDEEQYNLAREAIKPYLQVVDESKCSYTGYRLRDIWRYFRYTWSLPYKRTPGRNRFYLIRDASQPYHPIIGISALGNTVLNLSKRDNYIGWTLEFVKNRLNRNKKVVKYKETLKGDLDLKRDVQKTIYLETEGEYSLRIKTESSKLIRLFNKFIKQAINKVYIKDLIKENILTKEDIDNPNIEIVKKLESIFEDLRKKQLENKKSTGEIDWKAEAKTTLFKKKRVRELARLLEAKLIIYRILNQVGLKLDQLGQKKEAAVKALNKLVNYKAGKVVNIALEANRKQKIGSNIMEIIVCGAIPPYNHLLGGKLVALLTCSPIVIKDYNNKYSSQVSRIASKMNGGEVIRDSRLAYLGTTSLYGIGSSQYNRLKMSIGGENYLKFTELGKTEGYTSVYFADDTMEYISKTLEIIEGGRTINNIFGEGTSPRMRLLRKGISALGLKNSFLKQENKRIIYGIELASNAREFLRGETDELNYFYPLDGNEEKYTQQIIEFWRKRWFLKRIYTCLLYTSPSPRDS